MMIKFSKNFSGRYFLYFFIGIASGCSTVASHTTDKTASSAFNEPETTYLGKAAAEFAASHGGESGFLLIGGRYWLIRRKKVLMRSISCGKTMRPARS
jgi:hypothetical protein